MNITNLINLTETHFRGKKKSVVAEELSAFCEENNLQERDVKTIISKMHLSKRRRQPGFKTKYPSRRKPKVTARVKNNHKVISTLVPKVEKERYHPMKRERVWTFNNTTKKWTSVIVHDPDYVKETRYLKSSLPKKHIK